MDKQRATDIVEYLQESGIEATLYEDYSGRGMYGKTTAAVVTDSATDVAFALGALIAAEKEEVPDLVQVQTDGMGRQIVVY